VSGFLRFQFHSYLLKIFKIKLYYLSANSYIYLEMFYKALGFG